MSDLKMHIGRPGAWVEVTGEDSFPFLQGQFSNDLRSTAPSPATYGLWLNRKGKVLADSFVLQESAERFHLLSYFCPAGSLMERLEPFIIADDVVLRDLTPHAASATVWGSALHELFSEIRWSLPDPSCFGKVENGFLFRGRRSARPSAELVAIGDDSEQAIATLSAAVRDAGGELVSAEDLERDRIESAIPAIPRDVGPSDLPQEGNLEHEALSYNKGCYLGQEVMARLQSMGQVRRQLRPVRIYSPGTPVPAPLYAGGQEAGELRSAAGKAGLAMVRRNAADQVQRWALAPDGEACIQILPAVPENPARGPSHG